MVGIISQGELRAILDIYFKSFKLHSAPKAPLFIFGPPGVGKTEIVKSVAAEHGLGVITVQLSGYRPQDLVGVPIPREEKLVWHAPNFDDWADPQSTCGKYVIFLDELTAADPSVQAIALRWVREGKLGHLNFPRWKYCFVIAGNREEDSEHAFTPIAALLDRCEVYLLEVSATDWLAWAREAKLHNAVVEFIERNPDLLYVKDKTSPRRWEAVSNVLVQSWGSNLLEKRIAAIVGGEVATKFINFLLLYTERTIDPINFPSTPLELIVKQIGTADAAVNYLQQLTEIFDRLLDEKNAETLAEKYYALVISLIEKVGAEAVIFNISSLLKTLLEKLLEKKTVEHPIATFCESFARIVSARDSVLRDYVINKLRREGVKWE
ncbi:MAG: MoxR family ATPase [Candidatus Korarchaeum sp.]|nr:MoxR family ATPase [Candidatus Korarchaeum sp.]